MKYIYFKIYVYINKYERLEYTQLVTVINSEAEKNEIASLCNVFLFSK